MPRESIPEYSASLQPKAQNTDTKVILNGLETALESAIKIPIFKIVSLRAASNVLLVEHAILE